MIGNIGPMEIGIVLVIALLVFGPKRLPELGGSLGKGIHEFTRSVTGHAEDQPEPIERGETAEVVAQTAGTPVD